MHSVKNRRNDKSILCHAGSAVSAVMLAILLTIIAYGVRHMGSSVVECPFMMRSSQCFTTSVPKAVVCTILYVGWCM